MDDIVGFDFDHLFAVTKKFIIREKRLNMFYEQLETLNGDYDHIFYVIINEILEGDFEATQQADCRKANFDFSLHFGEYRVLVREN